MITHIFIGEKSYSMNSNLSAKNSTIRRRRILMNTCISKERRTRSKKNAKSSMNKKMITTMITNKIKTKRKSGMRFMTVNFLWILYYPYIYTPNLGVHRRDRQECILDIFPPKFMESLVSYG